MEVFELIFFMFLIGFGLYAGIIFMKREKEELELKLAVLQLALEFLYSNLIELYMSKR